MTSFLGVPIRAGDRQLGQIYLTDKLGAGEFNADDEKIIQMLAAYAAAAIQNARMMEQMKERDIALTRRNVDMALLNGIASTLTASLELDEILNKTLGLVMNYLKVEAGEIFLLEDDKDTLRLVLHRGLAAEAFWTRNRFKLGEGFVGLVASGGEPILSRDLAGDVRFLRDAVVKAGFRQMACLPLRSSENTVGVLTVATRGEEPFDERGIQLLEAAGNWAGLAIENAAGYSVGGCITSILVGFVGAVIGTWIAGALGLPEIFAINVAGRSFPIVWSVIGSALFVAVLALLTRGRVTI